MRLRLLACCLFATALLSGCAKEKYEKGFSVSPKEPEYEGPINGFSRDSSNLETRPGAVLLTGEPDHRLTPVYMLNYRKNKSSFTGTNDKHRDYSRLGRSKGNAWHGNFMPGIEAVYGFNMINISHYQSETGKQQRFFSSPVLVRTLYYPSFTQDSLYGEPVNRDYYMVSAYNEDTNNDGVINLKDLRRFFCFDLNLESKRLLIPEDYCVLRSQYDSKNDQMLVYAQQDSNGNGQVDATEEQHIFWIDLKNPENVGRLY